MQDYIKIREDLFNKEFTEVILCEEECCGAKPVGRMMKDEVDSAYLIKQFNSQTIKGLISKIIEENERREKDINCEGMTPSTIDHELDSDIGYNQAIEDINNSLKEIL